MLTSPQVSAAELAVVMPIYNEAANIAAVLQEWFSCLRIVCPNFILFAIDDGSKDETAQVLSSLQNEFGQQLRIVNKPNSGHGLTCREGYELALSEGAEWILQIDSDGQCDPAFFNSFYTDRTECDCVFAYRRTRDDGWGRVMVSRCCQLLLWFMTGRNLIDPNVPYRLMRAGSLRKALRRVPSDFELQNVGLTFALNQQELTWKFFPIHFP